MNKRLDILNRDEFINQVFALVERISDNKKNSTFAIDGKWGTGKTFILDVLENKLKDFQTENTNDNKYLVFHYNCWEYDYYEEPITAIVSSMLESARNEYKLIEEAKAGMKAGWKKAKDELSAIAGELVKNKIGINVIQVINDIKDESERVKKDEMQFDTFLSFKSVIKDTREKLRKISEDKSIVIVVDELDRCLPEYSIKVLERLHHLFNDIDNLIVVIATDKKQLENSIKNIFGDNIIVDSYLRKFIDFYIELDIGKMNQQFSIKYDDYINKFTNLTEDNLSLINDIASNLFIGIDIRTQEKLLKKVELIHSLVCKDSVDISILGFEILCVRFMFTMGSLDLRWVLDNSMVTHTDSQGRNYIKELAKSAIDDNKGYYETPKNKYYIIKDNIVSKIWWYIANLYRQSDEIQITMCAGLNNGLAERDKENVEIAIMLKKFIEIIK